MSRRLFARSGLTQREVDLLRGICAAVIRSKKTESAPKTRKEHDGREKVRPFALQSDYWPQRLHTKDSFPMFERIREDLKTIFERDPAAHSKLEVALCYPGFHALIMHRWAYWCNLQGWPTFARWVSHAARF